MNQNQENPNQLNETTKGVVALVQIIIACVCMYMGMKALLV